MTNLTKKIYTSKAISTATSVVILFFVLACSNQPPIAQPIVTVKLKNSDAVSEKSKGDSVESSDEIYSDNQTTAAISSADLSSELLNHIATATETSVAPLSTSNLNSSTIKEKCGFVVAPANLNEVFKQKAESRGWLSATKPNFFKLKVDDGSRSYQQCRCLAASVTAATGVHVIPILNP